MMVEPLSKKNTSENKRLAKNTVFLYIRMLFNMAIALYTSRIVLSTLGVEDYGIYNVVGGIVSLTTFLNGMMTAATQRFLNIEIGRNNSNNITKVFSTSLQIHMGICLIVLLIAETAGIWFLNSRINIPLDRLYAANWVFQFSMLSSLIAILSAPYNAAIIAYEKMSVFAYISIFEVSFKLFIVYLLMFSPIDKLIFYALLLFIVQLIVRFIYGYYVSRHFKSCHYQNIYEKKLLKEMLSFASWSFMGIVSGIGYTQGISIILNIFFGVTVNAARGITTQVQGAIQGFITNFQVAVNPQLYKSYAINDLNRMTNLIYSSSRFSFYLMLILSLPIFFEVEPILTLWLKNVPDHTSEFVRYILLIMLFETLTNPIIVAINATGQIKKCQLIVGLLLLSILPISCVAFKFNCPPESAYLIQFIMLFCAQVARFLILKPMINISLKEYFRRVVFNVLLVFVVAGIIPLFIYVLLPQSIFTIISVMVSSIISTMLAVYFIGMNIDERQSVRKLVRKTISDLH